MINNYFINKIINDNVTNINKPNEKYYDCDIRKLRDEWCYLFYGVYFFVEPVLFYLAQKWPTDFSTLLHCLNLVC